jgi:hypothetical protein
VPEIHLPHLEEEAEGEAETHPAPSKTSRRWKSALKIGLEVLLITSGVFLGLLGEQWRENVHHRELAEASLQRFRAEFRRNRGEVERVHDRHVKERKDLEAYFAAHGNELNAHLVDPRKPIPGPVPDNVTDSAGFDYSAWDLALATQSLSYIDPDLVASMSAAYRMQQMYEDAHRAIAQTSYSFTDPVYWLRGVTNYFGDAALWEELLLKRYDDLLPRLDRALGESPATGNVVK